LPLLGACPCACMPACFYMQAGAPLPPPSPDDLSLPLPPSPAPNACDFSILCGGMNGGPGATCAYHSPVESTCVSCWSSACSMSCVTHRTSFAPIPALLFSPRSPPQPLATRFIPLSCCFLLSLPSLSLSLPSLALMAHSDIPLSLHVHTCVSCWSSACLISCVTHRISFAPILSPRTPPRPPPTRFIPLSRCSHRLCPHSH